MSSVIPAVLAVGVAVAALCWAVLARRNPVHTRVEANLTNGFQHVADAGHGVRTAAAVNRVTRSLTPPPIIRSLEHKLALAGRPAAWPIEKLLLAKIVLGVVGTALAYGWITSHTGALQAAMAASVAVVAYFVPDLLLSSRGQERQKAIGLELADTLDQMSIAVAAGLAFESAMMRSAKNGKGPLAEELTRTLQDMRFGLSRRDAYLALAARTNVPDLRRFLRAIVQADAYGVAITDVLRTQAAEMRLKRRQRAETKAMQIPVKVIFPLMLCILPTLFIVLLGPAVLNIIQTFSK